MRPKINLKLYKNKILFLINEKVLYNKILNKII